MKSDPYGERSFEKGSRAAFSFGAEFQANPGSDKKEYLDSAAFYFRDDAEKVSDLNKEESRELYKQFAAGREAERKHQ